MPAGPEFANKLILLNIEKFAALNQGPAILEFLYKTPVFWKSELGRIDGGKL